jgi:hypothetical protein
MTEKNKIPTRDKWWGRRVIICECRVPDYYTQEDGTFAGRKPIKAGLVKAVLHEIASWDQPGARNYPSNEKVAYNTQIPLSTVNACTLALKQAKILVKTKRGMNRSSLWILDWSRIDNLRVAWERKPGKPEIEPAPVEDYDEETEAQFAKLNEAASTEPPDPHDPPASTDQTDLLVDEVLQHFAKHAETSTKLPRPHVIKAISRLRQLHDVETIRVAIVALDEIQLSFTLEAENPGGYLWRVLSNLIKDRADRPAPAGSDPQKTQAKDKDKEYAKKLTAYFADQWINDDEEPTPAYEHSSTVTAQIGLFDSGNISGRRGERSSIQLWFCDG